MVPGFGPLNPGILARDLEPAWGKRPFQEPFAKRAPFFSFKVTLW